MKLRSVNLAHPTDVPGRPPGGPRYTQSLQADDFDLTYDRAAGVIEVRRKGGGLPCFVPIAATTIFEAAPESAPVQQAAPMTATEALMANPTARAQQQGKGKR